MTQPALLAADAGRRGRGDDGTALVEAAFVTPLLFLLLLGTLEWGLYFKDYLTVSNALRAGGRMAAVAGDDVDADYRIIQAVRRESSAVPQNSIKRLVVWKASAFGDTVPTSCKTTAAPGTVNAGGVQCNIYAPSRDWNPAAPPPAPPNTPASNYDCIHNTWANGWCPTTRFSALTAAPAGSPGGVHGPPDYVGIYLQLDHKFISGLFGTQKTMEATLVVRIEPKTKQ